MTDRTPEERALVDKVAAVLEGAGLKVHRDVSVSGATAALSTIPAADRQVTAADNERKPELDLQQHAGTAPNDPKRANVGRLPQFVTRIEKLEEERKAIGGDIKDVYSEAKGVGYDVKTIRKLVALRRLDAADRAEQETLLDVYKHALGMV